MNMFKVTIKDKPAVICRGISADPMNVNGVLLSIKGGSILELDKADIVSIEVC